MDSTHIAYGLRINYTCTLHNYGNREDHCVRDIFRGRSVEYNPSAIIVIQEVMFQTLKPRQDVALPYLAKALWCPGTNGSADGNPRRSPPTSAKTPWPTREALKFFHNPNLSRRIDFQSSSIPLLQRPAQLPPSPLVTVVSATK